MACPNDGTPFSLNDAATGFWLGIEANADYAGANVVAVASSDDSAPRWTLRQEQNAHYLINASVPNMCLNVAYESKSSGATLQQWDCNGGASELWTLSPATDGSFSLVNMNSGLAVGAAGPVVDSPIAQMASSAQDIARWDIVLYDSHESRAEATVETETIATLTKIYAPLLADEMIYNIYVPIYSQHGRLQAVIQDLPRIARLGFSTILVMPVHPIGVPVGHHPAVGSPYAVADFHAIAPELGHFSDFKDLVRQSHSLGIKIIMDVVLNHTAWNNPLIMAAPHYFVHTNNKVNDPNTIAHAFWFKDVAQLDFKCGTHVRDFMITMLKWWMTESSVDGFRFDTADNPSGKDRMIPAKTWAIIGQELKSVNPRVILLGECTNPDLSLRPFNMDYTNYSLQPAVTLATRSQDARGLSRVLDQLKAEHPVGMLHTSIMQTWDMDLDLRMYGGPDGTMVAAVFNSTIEGVPMLFAGEEVANDRGGVNTHAAINWNGPLAARFHEFYTQLGMLRRTNPALRRGSTTWLKVAGGSIGLIAYLRTWENEQSLVAINFSASVTQGVLQGVPPDGWRETTPVGALRPATHPTPPSLTLGPWDFAVFALPDEESEAEDNSQTPADTLVKYAPRPAECSLGQAISLFANHVKLNVEQGVVFHRYSVKITPEVYGKKCEQVINIMLQDHEKLATLEAYLVTTSVFAAILQRASRNTELYIKSWEVYPRASYLVLSRWRAKSRYVTSSGLFWSESDLLLINTFDSQHFTSLSIALRARYNDNLDPLPNSGIAHNSPAEQSPVITAMDLPAEINLNIVELLERTDPKSVRLVSKTWSACASTFLFDRIYVSSAKEDLEIFEAVAQDPLLSKCVRHLTYDATEFLEGLTKQEYFAQLWLQRPGASRSEGRISRNSDPDVKYWENEVVIFGMPFTDASAIFMDSFFIHRGYQSYIAHASYQQFALRSGQFLQRLARGLEKLGELRTVVLEGSWDVFGWKDEITRVGLRPTGSYLARVWESFYCKPQGWRWGLGEQWERRTGRWTHGTDGSRSYKIITSALAHAQRQILSFTIAGNGNSSFSGLPPTSFSPGEYTSFESMGRSELDHAAFSELEEFVLQGLDSYSPEDKHNERTVTKYPNVTGLPLLLASMGSLQRLELTLCDDRCGEPLFYRDNQVLPKDTVWHCLESLKLSRLSITAHGLLHLILIRMPNLQHLEIGCIKLLEGSWEAVFEALAEAMHLDTFTFEEDTYLYHYDGILLKYTVWTNISEFTEYLEEYVVWGGRHPCLHDDQPDDEAEKWLQEFEGPLLERIVQLGKLNRGETD